MLSGNVQTNTSSNHNGSRKRLSLIPQLARGGGGGRWEGWGCMLTAVVTVWVLGHSRCADVTAGMSLNRAIESVFEAV